jgi:hypothetical protein
MALERIGSVRVRARPEWLAAAQGEQGGHFPERRGHGEPAEAGRGLGRRRARPLAGGARPSHARL